jgi:hypothetical protein
MRCWTRSGRPVSRRGNGCEAGRSGLEDVGKFVAWLRLPACAGRAGNRVAVGEAALRRGDGDRKLSAVSAFTSTPPARMLFDT